MGLAQDLQRWFPSEPLTAKEIEALLTPELLGPPATTYDAVSTSQLTGHDGHIIALARGTGADHPEVSTALQRYAQVTLQLMRKGRPDDVHRWWVAEHVGLAQAPRIVGTFVAANDEDAAAVVGQVLQRQRQEVPVTVATTEAGKLLAGIVVALDVTATFEPFPRGVTAGTPVRIAGKLNTVHDTAIYVQGAGAAVAVVPIATGPFEVVLPAPANPGAVRVAVAPRDPRQLPTEPMFFTLYVGQQPPVGPDPSQLGDDVGASVSRFERKVLDALDAERKRFGLPPLARRDPPEKLATLLSEIPPGDAALAPKLNRALQNDPLPGERHGGWGTAFARDTHGPSLTALAWLSHPAWRRVLLDPEAHRIQLLTRANDGGTFDAVVIVVARPPVGSVRDRAWAQIAARWPSGAAPQAAPKLEAALADLARLRASGSISHSQFEDRLDIVFLSTKLVPGRATAYTRVVRPGEDLDTSPMKLEDGAKYLAIGVGTGSMGLSAGPNHTFVVAVASDKAY